MTNQIEISVVMPCLNEALTLKTCIEKALRCFSKYGLNGEVIIADNGSTDGSQDIARASGARVVHQPVKGYGAALRKGFEEARGTYIVMGDADDSYDFGEVNRFVEKLREGYDLVMGSRFKGEIKKGAMPWHHQYFGNPVLTGILNVLYRSGISDAHCGLRGFRKDAIAKMDLRTFGMEFASEMVIKSVRNGLKVGEIPITLHPDGRNRPPHLRSFRDGWRHLRMMLFLAPDTLFIWPGIVLFILGFILQTSIVLGGPLSLGQIKLAENTMILCMMLTVIGLQMVYLGIFSYLFISSAQQLTSGKKASLLNYAQFEKGLILGLIFILIGFIGDAFVIKSWHAVQFGSLDLASIRHSIFFSTILIVGFQTLISSLFLNMIGVERAVYSADWKQTHSPSK